MPSLLPGFEYDIFISYRQKDNKHDGWVTEFVDNLKDELESTFKEDISVYFDINPHDGLLETHDVSASLKEKLKCLILIPVISQTYCDSNSFAWQNEFMAFNKLVKEDEFGRDIRLTGGNVASRIFPVKINDLDPQDKILLENELGGVVRCIEFIYREAGVNRPLSPDDDAKENLNRTKYKNQVNKVANAVKEIITAMMNHHQHEGKVLKEVVADNPEAQRKLYPKIIIASFFVLALILLVYFFKDKLFESSKQVETTVAVLPFKLISGELDKQYLADAMMEDIRLNLSKIKELQVRSSTSVEQYRATTKTARQIGKELDVEFLLEGRFQKDGDKVRLIVQLIKASEEKHAWADEYERDWTDVFSIQSEVAQTIARELHVVISSETKKAIEKKPTTSLIAYDFYQRGRKEYSKFMIDNNNISALHKADSLFHMALENDSTFAQAYTGLAQVYWGKYYYKEYFSQSFLDSVLLLANIALSYDDQLAEAYYLRGGYYVQKGLTNQAIEEFDKTLKYNPNDWMAYSGKGELYLNSSDYVEAISNLQIAASLNYGPELPLILINLGIAYFSAGFVEKTKEYVLEIMPLVGSPSKSLWYQAQMEYFLGNYEKAIEFLVRGYEIDSNDVEIIKALGSCYSFVGQYEESLRYFDKSIKMNNALGHFDVDGTQRIGYAYWKNGNRKEADYYFDKQIEYSEKSILNNRPYALSKSAYYDLAGVYAFRGNKEKAYENLRIYNQKQRIEFYRMIYIKNDPLFNSIRNEPDFQHIMEIEAKCQAEHERVRKWLEEQGML